MASLPENPDFEAGIVVPVDKPLEWSSADVVRKMKFALQRLGYRKIKIGHAGTLDPLATGILLVCIGRATKRVEELQSQPKQYRASVTFGGTTPSYDMEHPVSETHPWQHITREGLLQAMQGLCGERLQSPPVYSAKMIEGRRAYEYAREGTQVEMRQALVNIYSMELQSFQAPVADIVITCSKGTYIRSIAKELGEALHSGAYLSALCRTGNGAYGLEDCSTMEQVEEWLSGLKAAPAKN